MVSVLRAEEREDPVSRRALGARLCQFGIRAHKGSLLSIAERRIHYSAKER
jgi:hypothetical protein